jgi:hypothetical protein
MTFCTLCFPDRNFSQAKPPPVALCSLDFFPASKHTGGYASCYYTTEMLAVPQIYASTTCTRCLSCFSLYRLGYKPRQVINSPQDFIPLFLPLGSVGSDFGLDLCLQSRSVRV